MTTRTSKRSAATPAEPTPALEPSEEIRLEDLVPLEEYRQSRTVIFRSQTGLEWLIRHNRNRLTRAGALLVLGGRRFANPPVFDREVLAIGREAACGAID